MKYEQGMHIIYDVLKKGVFIEFRGRSDYLPGPFSSQKDAISAAEDFCRAQGWNGTPPSGR